MIALRETIVGTPYGRVSSLHARIIGTGPTAYTASMPPSSRASFSASVTPFLLLLPGLIGFTSLIVFSNALVASSPPSPSRR